MEGSCQKEKVSNSDGDSKVGNCNIDIAKRMGGGFSGCCDKDILKPPGK